MADRRAAPAVLLCAALAAAGAVPARPADVAGWDAARWGMSGTELDAAFAGRIEHLEGRVEYYRAYADRIVRDVAVGPVLFVAYLQLGSESGRLVRVLLERRGATDADYRAARAALTRRWGAPDARDAEACVGPADTARGAAWLFPTTEVHLCVQDLAAAPLVHRDPLRDPDPLARQSALRRNNPRFLPRRLTIRFEPARSPGAQRDGIERPDGD